MNFVLLFIVICQLVKPDIKHVLIGVISVSPYQFLIYYFFTSKYVHFDGLTTIAVSIMMFIIALLVLAAYYGRKTMNSNWQVILFIIFLFLLWSPLLVILQYITN